MERLHAGQVRRPRGQDHVAGRQGIEPCREVLETKPSPSSARPKKQGSRAPVIATAVRHRRELLTCKRTVSAPERNCTSDTMVRSHVLYLLSYGGKKLMCATDVPLL